MLRQNGHEIREDSAKRHRGAPLYESKDPGTAPRDNRCAGGNVGACMGGGKRKEFMDCIEKGGAFRVWGAQGIRFSGKTKGEVEGTSGGGKPAAGRADPRMLIF